MATVSRRTTKSASRNGNNGKATKTTEVTTDKLAKTLVAAIEKKFGVVLDNRQQRISKKVGYAARERLGKNLLGLAKDDFSWETWNKIFEKIFGAPTNLKYPPETIAQVMASIYHDIPIEAEEAVQALIEYNNRSLEERNKREERKGEEDLSDIEELLEDENEEIEEEFDDDELDLVDEEEEFEDDDLEDFDEED